MQGKYLLSIDNGSQSIRALLFDFNGNLLFRQKVDIQAYFSKREGWAEQHPEYYWDKIGEACHGLWAQGANPNQVVGVSVTTQRNTMVFLDKDGNNLRPAITWMDEREQNTLPPMPLHWKFLIGIAGKSQTLKFARARAQSNWVAQNQPDIWAKTAKYLQLSGFLHFKLTGQYKDATANQVGYLPYDFKKFEWVGANQWHWPAFQIRAEQLPELIKPADKVGDLLPEPAQHLGLPAGLPVIASGSDKACELVGAGLLEEDIACLSYGTRATINTHNKKYREPVKNMPSFTAALSGLYSVEVAVPRGFWMVSWFKKEFGLKERKKAKKRGIEAEVLFDKLIKKAPAGSGGLVLQPYWGHEANEGAEARGAIIGFSESHTRAHFYRAMVEGIAFALLEGKDKIEKSGVPPITKLRVSGGGSQSDQVMQITADVFNLPAERSHTFETSGLGAAIITAIGLGVYPDYETAIQKMSRTGDVFMPIQEHQAIYQSLYSHVYRKMYSRLKPLYQVIHKLFPH